MSSFQHAASVAEILKDLSDAEYLKVLHLLAVDRGLSLGQIGGTNTSPEGVSKTAKKAKKKKSKASPLEEKSSEPVVADFSKIDISFIGDVKSSEDVEGLSPAQVKEFHKELSKTRKRLLKEMKRSSEGCPDHLKVVFNLYQASLDAWIKVKGSFPAEGSL
jgi:hypothetical protein